MPKRADERAVFLKNLHYSWNPKREAVVSIPEFSIARGERVLIQGPSGSGKTTLLNILAGVVEPGSGTVEILGEDMTMMRASKRDRFRADHLGVVFQQFNLLNYLTVWQNITLPLHFSKRRKAQAAKSRTDASALLESLDLEPSLYHHEADRLSVGQQQRIALARALIGAPEIIIADEPTSALDKSNSERFMELLTAQCKQAGSTLIMVSHDESLGRYFDRVVAFDTLQGAIDA